MDHGTILEPNRGKEFAAARLAKFCEGNKKLTYSRLAVEFAQSGQEGTTQEWTTERLNTLAGYVREGESVSRNDPFLRINRAFIALQRALRQPDAQPQANLQSAESDFRNGIKALEAGTSDPVALYDARWRLSNCLVSRAFAASNQGKKQSFLVDAKSFADAAVSMIPELRNDPIRKNPARLTYGNSCEDLAYYCDFERTSNYKLAIDQFKKAVVDTTWGDPLWPRICLARCRRRFAQHGGNVDLELAIQDMKECPSNANPRYKAEFYLWRGQLHDRLGGRKSAIADLKMAYRVATNERSSIGESFVNAIAFAYADLLRSSASAADRKEAIGILKRHFAKVSGDSIGDTSTWFKARCMLCGLLSAEESHQEMTQFVSLAVELSVDVLRIDPVDTSRRLAELSGYVRAAGFPAKVGGTASVDSRTAETSLSAMEKVTSRLMDSQSPAATYARIVKANKISLERPLPDRIRAYLEALLSTHIAACDSDVIHATRRGMLAQFSQIFASERRFEVAAANFPQLSLKVRSRVDEQFKRMLRSGKQLEQTERNDVESLRGAFANIPAM